MKARVRFDTLSDIKNFVNAVNKVTAATDVHLTDGHLTVSARSILGVRYSMEWDEIYCTCEKDIYHAIRQFVVEE